MDLPLSNLRLMFTLKLTNNYVKVFVITLGQGLRDNLMEMYLLSYLVNALQNFQFKSRFPAGCAINYLIIHMRRQFVKSCNIKKYTVVAKKLLPRT